MHMVCRGLLEYTFSICAGGHWSDGYALHAGVACLETRNAEPLLILVIIYMPLGTVFIVTEIDA